MAAGEHEAVPVGPVRRGGVQRTVAAGARAMGVPGWPLEAFSTASMARTRMLLMAAQMRGSSSEGMVTEDGAGAVEVRVLLLATGGAESGWLGTKLNPVVHPLSLPPPGSGE